MFQQLLIYATISASASVASTTITTHVLDSHSSTEKQEIFLKPGSSEDFSIGPLSLQLEVVLPLTQLASVQSVHPMITRSKRQVQNSTAHSYLSTHTILAQPKTISKVLAILE